MDRIDMQDGAVRLIKAENPRADAGIVFLAGMLIAGALTIGATLSLAEAPADAGTKPAAVSAP